MTRQARVLLLALVVSVLASVGCPERTTIAEINRDPGRFRDKDVTIVGEVVNSFGVLGQGAYEVDDGTGRIWVLTTTGGAPGNGARVRVTGRVSTGVTVAGRSFGTVLRESKRELERSGP